MGLRQDNLCNLTPSFNRDPEELPRDCLDLTKKPGRQLPAASALGKAQTAACGPSDAIAAGGC